MSTAPQHRETAAKRNGTTRLVPHVDGSIQREQISSLTIKNLQPAQSTTSHSQQNSSATLSAAPDQGHSASTGTRTHARTSHLQRTCA